MKLFCAVLIFLVSTLHADPRPIYPPALKKGDTIAIVAPASCPEEDQATIARAVKLITQKGYKVRVASNLLTRYGYLAGTDYDRAKAFMDAWLDPEIKAIWCYRGGFGCTRILDRLDYEAIRRQPKILIGMSDITALHAAINKETGLVTFLGPNVNGVFGREISQDSPFSERQLWSFISPESSMGAKGYLYTNPRSFPSKEHAVMTLKGGVGRGRLTGGTLSLVSALVGTPWQVDTRGKILILEEVDEQPYRIDRMLSQLKHAGLLEDPAGVILCSWKACNGRKPDKSLGLEQVFKDYFSNVPYPVLLGFPSGHITEQDTLPLNSLAELDATNKKLRLLEDPVELR